MTHTVDKLIEDGYKGYSVRHILMNQEFRKRVINDPSVRGNIDAKNLIMDKLAVGGKVLITGVTSEGKSMFARILNLSGLIHRDTGNLSKAIESTNTCLS